MLTYITETYRGHVIGLANGHIDDRWGDFVVVDGVIYKEELFSNPANALKAARWIVDNMLKDVTA